MSTPTAAPSAPASAVPPRHRWRRWSLVALGALVGLPLLLVLLLWLFPWDWLRPGINRLVSERTGRHFAITRHLDVRLGRVSTVVLDGVEWANPDWARDRWLLRAERAEFELRLWPLLRHRQLVLPRLSLTQPELGLQQMPDGRSTWSLERGERDGRSVPEVGELRVDRGRVHYFAPGQQIDLSAEVALAPEKDSPLPLRFQGQGQWRGERFVARGRTGGVLRFSQDRAGDFPLDIEASAGRTRLAAQGRVTHLAELAGMDLRVQLSGDNLARLWRLGGAALPDSPPYDLRGQLRKDGRLWQVSALEGRIGRSDVQGDLRWDLAPPRPLLSGQVVSQRLDLADLGPMLGWSPPQRTAAVRSPGRRPPRAGPVLPAKPLELSRLQRLDLDLDLGLTVRSIRNAPQWPLQSVQTRARLAGGRLQLEPLQLGVAGGRLSGSFGLDASRQPAALRLDLQAQALQLQQLFPAVEATRSSLGSLHGKVKLQGQGASVAQMLGAASGEVSLLMGQGRVSNLLLELMGLDGGEIIKFLVRGDQNVRLRCAAVAFDVNQGRMDSRVMLIDTVDTVIRGQGRVGLAQESLDLYFEPEPKDPSILSLRSPLRITGTFGAPQAGPDKGALASRAGLALALGAINPLLALAATVETGPGQDANCGAVLRQAAAPRGTPEARGRGAAQR